MSRDNLFTDFLKSLAKRKEIVISVFNDMVT